METLGLLWALARLAFLIRLAETRAAWEATYQQCAGRYRIGMRAGSARWVLWMRCRVRRFVRTPSVARRYLDGDADYTDTTGCGCKEGD